MTELKVARAHGIPLSQFRAWAEPDRLLALAYQKYEDGLCQGCGWPRTYSMHKDARGHFHGSQAIICHGCAEKERSERAGRNNPQERLGSYYTARPDDGLWHAMSDPVLTYPPDTAEQAGVSGVVYSPGQDSTAPEHIVAVEADSAGPVGADHRTETVLGVD